MCDEYEEGAIYKLKKDYTQYVFLHWTKQNNNIWIDNETKIIHTKNDTGELKTIPTNTDITVEKNGIRTVYGVKPASIFSYTITVDGTPLTYYFALTHEVADEIAKRIDIGCGIAGGRRRNRSRKSKNRRSLRRSRRHYRTK
jgi:hypothetical protein